MSVSTIIRALIVAQAEAERRLSQPFAEAELPLVFAISEAVELMGAARRELVRAQGQKETKRAATPA